MKRMISRWRSAGAFPRAVSRRISPQLVSRDRVKCKTHNFCSASAEGESFLHPATWQVVPMGTRGQEDRKSTRLNSSHGYISYAVFCLKKRRRVPGAPARSLPHTSSFLRYSPHALPLHLVTLDSSYFTSTALRHPPCSHLYLCLSRLLP